MTAGRFPPWLVNKTAWFNLKRRSAMSHKKWFLIFGAALMIVFLFSCSSDEENPVTPTKPKPPEFTLKPFDFPAKMVQSADEMAKRAMTLAAECTAFDGTGCIFAAPQNAQANKEESGDWEYQWITGTLTQKLKMTAGSGRLTWQLYLNGSENGINYVNWRSMDAVQRSDQSNGHVYLYRTGTQQISIEWVWYVLETNDYKYVKQLYDDPTEKIEFTIMEDKSGKMERFVPSSKGGLVYDLRITWNADGTGAWWTYNEGVQTGYGTWN
jgi:hypothetical protein